MARDLWVSKVGRKGSRRVCQTCGAPEALGAVHPSDAERAGNPQRRCIFFRFLPPPCNPVLGVRSLWVFMQGGPGHNAPHRIGHQTEPGVCQPHILHPKNQQHFTAPNTQIMFRLQRSMLILLSLLALGLGSCNWGPCLKGDGPIVEEARSLEPFDRVRLEGSMDLTLIPDSNYRIIIYAQENIIERIQTEVSAGELRLDQKSCLTSNKDIRAEIYAPLFRALTIKGSGDVTNTGTLDVDAFDLLIDGSGDVQLKVLVEDIETRISGSGDVRLDGIATNQIVDIRGSGDVRAFDLDTENTEVDINGSGDVRIRANNSLDVRIDGSGDVYYKGFPSITIDINGSGDLIDAN